MRRDQHGQILVVARGGSWYSRLPFILLYYRKNQLRERDAGRGISQVRAARE